MNELNKLIEKWCGEEGTPAFMIHALIKEVEDEKGTWLNKLLLWLATRPTCTATERKFLDEFRIKFKWGVSFDDPKGYVTYFRENGDFVYKLSQSEFESILKELVNE